MSLPNWLSPLFPHHGRKPRPVRRRVGLAGERLEDRVTPAFAMTVSGTTATVTGDNVGDTLVITTDTATAGGPYIVHNRFTAGDAGFASDLDWDSVAPGDQKLLAVATTTVAIPNSGGGDDTIRLVRGVDGATGSGDVNAVIDTSASGGDIDRFEIDDSTRTTAAVYGVQVTPGTVTGPGIDFDLGAFHKGGLFLTTGQGSDTVTVAATFGFGQSVTVNSAGGADAVTVGSAGSVQNIQSDVTVRNTAGLSTLAVDDSADATARTANLTNISLTGLAPAAINYTGAEVSQLTVSLGSGGNTANVTSTIAGATTVNGGGGADTFNITGAGLGAGSANGFNGNGGADAFNLLSAATSGTVAVDGGAGTDTLTGPNATTAWAITGADAGTVVNGSHTFAGVENLTGGTGNDTFAFANGAGVTGAIDGGAGTNALDYSAYTSGVRANLGLNVAGLTAALDGRQENPPTSSPATGTATVTNYNPVARTFDISVTVANLDPTTVTGYHIHRAPVGVNGPIVIDLAAMFGLAALVPSGNGFTFNAIGVPLAAGDEAAFLGGVTYINFHTAQFPGGATRGQLFSTGNVGLAAGQATGAASVANIQNVTGGSSNDSLVGTTGVNVLSGGAGNDTILGAPGNDTLSGDANNDVLIWGNGDNTDVMDGGDGLDTVVVNGAVAAGDVFTVGAGPGGRLAFARTNLVPFALDIGTTEGLTVNGVGGDDTFGVGDLSTVTGVTDVKLNGFAGADTFNVVPDANATITVVGGDPPAAPGDVINFDAKGLALSVSATALAAAGMKPVNYREVEAVNLTNFASLSGTPADDTVVLAPTGPTTADLTVNGAKFTLTGLTGFRFDGGDGNDTFTLDNTAGVLAGPVEFNGDGQTGVPGDRFRTFGGTFATGVVTPTGPNSGTIQYSGAGLITFTGLEPIDDLNVVTDYVINATNDAESIVVADGPVVLATQTGQVSSGTGTFELVNFANKTNVTVNALDGADSMTAGLKAAVAGLASLTLNAGSGDDVVIVTGTAVPTAIDTGPGANAVTVGVAGGVQAIVGPVSVASSGGLTSLTLDNSADAVGRFVSVFGDGAGNIVVFGLAPASVTAVETQLSALTVSAGTGNDFFFIDRSVPAGTTTLNGGDGDDTFTVNLAGLAAGGTVVLDGQNGTDAATLNAAALAQAYTDPALGPPAVRFADNGNTGGVTLTSVEAVNLSSATGKFELLGDRGGATPEADAITVTGTGATAATASINGSAPFGLVNVSDLRVNTFALNDTFALTPFATPVQPWLVATTADLGDGLDRLNYTNVAGLFDDVSVVAVGVGSGRVNDHGVGSGTADQVVRFLNAESVGLTANAGDADRVRVGLPDTGATVNLRFSPDAGVPDLTMPGLFDIELDTVNYKALAVDGGAGSDTFVLDLVGPGGTAAGALPIPVTVNGGPPNTAFADQVRVVGNAGAPDQFANAAGADPQSGTVSIAGTDSGQLSYTGIEGIQFDGGGGAGDDVLTATGTNGADTFTLTETDATADGQLAVSGQPAMKFSGFGAGANSSVSLVGLGGDDLFTVNHAANWKLGFVSIDGGPPTASDTLRVTGSAADEVFTFTPSKELLTVAAGTTVTYAAKNVERFIADGAGGTNKLTVTEFMPGTLTLPNGSLGGNPRLDYLNMSAAVIGEVPVAVADATATDEDTAAVIAVLANDLGLANAPITVTVVTPPTLGTVVVNPDNTVTYTPNKDANGPDSFVYRVADANGESSTAVVSVTVTAVNDAPTLTVPGGQTVNEDTNLTFSAAGGNTIAVADLDAAAGAVTVTLAVAHGTLTLGSTAGLVVTGNGSGLVTATGTVASLNAALNGLVYRGGPNYFGPDSLAVTVNDNGNTGTGGPLTATGTVALTVVAVADAPILTVAPPAPGFEAVAVPLAVTSVLTDLSETLTLTISGVPAGTRFNRGLDGGSVWHFTPADLAGLTITVPDGPATLNLLVTATSATGVNASTASTSLPLVVTVGNTAPTGTLANSGPVAEGKPATVTFIAAADPSIADATSGFRYAFDFNNDGVFDLGDGTYAGSAVSNAAAIPATLLDDGPGTRTVRGRVLDKDGGFTEAMTTITVTNVAPTAVLANAGPVAEGGTGTVSFSGAADPSLADTLAGFRYAFDFDNDGVFEAGDGTYAGSGKAAIVTVPASFLADGGANRVVRGRVIDKDGGSTDYTTTIAVTNVAPTAVLTNAGPVAEGSTGTVNFAGPTDPSPADVAAGFRYAFDFNDDGVFEVGDGTYAGSSAAATATVPASFLADGAGTRTVRGRVIDKDGGATDYRTTLTVTNVAPTATLTNTGPVAEGGTATVAFANPTDPSPTDSAATFRYAFDFNNDGVFEVGDGTYAGSGINAAATVPASFLADGPGTRVVRGRVLDKDGGFTDYTTTVTLTNVAPTATLVSDGAAVAGGPSTVRFVNPTDPSPADVAAGFTYSFDANGDGVFEQVGKSAAFTIPATRLGGQAVRGRITDKDGGFTDYTLTVSGQGPGGRLDAGTYAVGAGPGGGPLVKVYNTDGSLRTAFFAYEASFRGGVHVAVGDVTGDGIPDIVAGAGDGGGPVVKVFDGVTLGEIATFFAYESTFRGGVEVAVGDLDGDGKGEVVTGSGNGGGPLVKVFSGHGELRTGFFAYESTFRGGVPVAAGDVDGDGKDEIVTGAGVGGGPVVKVFNGQTFAPAGAFTAFDAAARGGVSVAAGDVDGDGKAEIVAGPGPGSTPLVRTFAGVGFAPGGSFLAFDATNLDGTPNKGGVDVAARDINGDGRAEVLAASGRGLAPRITFRDGLTFTEIRSDVPFEADFLGGLFVG